MKMMVRHQRALAGVIAGNLGMAGFLLIIFPLVNKYLTWTGWEVNAPIGVLSIVFASFLFQYAWRR